MGCRNEALDMQPSVDMWLSGNEENRPGVSNSTKGTFLNKSSVDERNGELADRPFGLLL